MPVAYLPDGSLARFGGRGSKCVRHSVGRDSAEQREEGVHKSASRSKPMTSVLHSTKPTPASAAHQECAWYPRA
eukprot:scaffold4812_cov88-Phaeocystis_antarctica.AAC.4